MKINKELSGFKTVIFNLVALLAAWLATKYGIEVSEEQQTAIAVTIVCVINIILRTFTKTRIFKDS